MNLASIPFRITARLFKAFSTALAILCILAIAPHAYSQTISFATPERDTTNKIGGEVGETGVGAVNFNNALYVAYAGPTIVDSSHDANVYIAYNTDGSPTYGNLHFAVNDDNFGQPVISSNNPALTVWNDALWLATTQGNDPSGDGLAFLYRSTDGIHFSGFGGVCHPDGSTADIDGSPSLVAFNGSLYLGIRDHNTHAMVLCRYGADGSIVSNEISSITSNFNPSLAVFNGQLYAAIESNNSSHTLYFYTSSDGLTFTLHTGASSDQSSTAPSLAVHNNVLYLGFRTNDSSQVFKYKYSTDGTTFSSSIAPGWSEAGPPTLVEATNLPGSPYQGHLYVYFSSHTSAPNYLCSNHGN